MSCESDILLSDSVTLTQIASPAKGTHSGAKANPYGTNFLAESGTKTISFPFPLKSNPYGTRISTRTEKNSRRTPGISRSRRKFKKIPSASSARREFIWTKETLHSLLWLLGLVFTCSYRVVWASGASTLHPSHITPHTSPRIIWKAFIDMCNKNASLPLHAFHKDT
jgi:hypothetical protein